MTKHYIDIGGKWAVIFAYGIDSSDLDEIADWLDALGGSYDDIERACRLIMKPNTGFTFSDPNLRMSVMCVGRATSRDEWFDTLVHEIDHVQDAFCGYYGISHGSEDAAYLQGYLAREAFKLSVNDICPVCGHLSNSISNPLSTSS